MAWISSTCILLAITCYLYCCGLAVMAQSDVASPSTTPPPNPCPNRTLTTDQRGNLSLSCDVIQQTKFLFAMNVSDYSPEKHTQLEAMKIVGAQVKENICDWIKTVLRISEVVNQNSTCSDQALDELCRCETTN